MIGAYIDPFLSLPGTSVTVAMELILNPSQNLEVNAR